MGRLINGKWQDVMHDTKSNKGEFTRDESIFRAQYVSGESGRYHLYVSLACPWAHRTLIIRALKGLKEAISVSVVDFLMQGQGWMFSENTGCTLDTINHKNYLHEIYCLAKPDYSGRVTVPVLWDKVGKTIVNNESSEIIRLLNTGFNEVAKHPEINFYPEQYKNDIDEINTFVYENVNNGVYRCGFATTQDAYDDAVAALFLALDKLESRLAKSRYLVGDIITEADWRLFTTLVRFDVAYVGHFKCNKQRIADYENLSNYLRELYQIPGVADTVNFHHVKNHYYRSHLHINPNGIVPKGPQQNLSAPHNRAKLK